ncbi:hypothetical protein [Paraglaciecola chathamensis]|uniref:Sulfotransferase family protein n=1 Tax=Paraglaciecola chathamensis S18K6 TaxID=1127672 RepID=A0AAV3V1A9_9ALTE|nr:hypothetical protein [Paraglaciecola chathamensis]GAC10540.1 hypothetical protein GCHA_2593 [Paraglaciecola chathamensis S18K6]
MTVLSLGGWYVGNSAVLDWLDGFSSYYYLRGDFHDLRKYGGLYDCIVEKDHQRKCQIVDSELKHFCKGLLRPTKAFFNKSINGKVPNHPSLLNYNILMLFNYLTFRVHIRNKDFDQLAFWKKRLAMLTKISDNRDAKLVLQNPTYYDDIAPEHSAIWRELFENPKMFFVHRDPVDQFVQIYLADDLKYGNTRFRAGTENLNPVERYFYITKRTYISRINMLKKFPPNQLAVINFEKFAYASDEAIKPIRDFFDICSEREFNFNFEMTRGNVGLSKKNENVVHHLKEYSGQLEELYQLRNELSAAEHSVI